MVEAVTTGGAKPMIDGRTNLPDGVQLTVSLQPANAACPLDCEPIDLDAIVKNGRFTAGPFTRRGANLAPGKYALEITSGIARLQPVAVQAVIGPRGEFMIGKNVSMPEESSGESIVDYVSEIKVP